MNRQQIINTLLGVLILQNHNVQESDFDKPVRSLMDSLEYVELAMSLEQEFKTVFTNEELADAKTLTDLVNLIADRKSIAI